MGTQISKTQPEVQPLEIQSLMNAIFEKYGYDFHDYSQASFTRRVEKACVKYKCDKVSDLLEFTLKDPDFFPLLLNELTVNVTEIFRDPAVFKKLREEVIPYLRSYPELRIWCAGCATGEEVYSLAILLTEEGLYDKCLIYATDISPAVLKHAKEGIFSLDAVKVGTKNYFAAGGKASFSDYYTAQYGAAIMDPKLKKNIVFSDHNLVTDQSFGHMQLILCRNVLIYFNRQLQERAVGLFKHSLCSKGFLCLGTKEGLSFSKHQPDFEEYKRPERIYRKKL